MARTQLSCVGFRLVASLGALAMVAGACSSAGKVATDSTSGGLASLEVISSDVTRQGDPDEAPATASSGDSLDVGDTVSTDDTGFAEVGFFDGSLTRIDHAARFTLVDLQDPDQARVVHTQLTAGRSWNRIVELSESETWQTDTPVASATVRGTAFSVDCAIEVPDACRFAVVDGTVELTLADGSKLSVTAGQVVTVKKDAPPPTPATVGLPLLMADEWIARNVAADVEDGKPILDETASASAADGQYVLAAKTSANDNCEGDSYLDGETLTIAGSEAMVTVDDDVFGPSTIGPPDEYTGVREVTFVEATSDPVMVAPTVLDMMLILTGGGVWGTNRLSASLHPNAFGCNEIFTGRPRSADSTSTEPSREHCDELIQKAPEIVAAAGDFDGGGGEDGRCLDGWGVGSSQDQYGDEATVLFRWNGSAWEIVPRSDPCKAGKLPPELYPAGCQTN